MGELVDAAAAVTAGLARVDGSVAWLLLAPLALALWCELTPTVTVSPMVIAGPLMLAFGPGAELATAPGGVGTRFAAPEDGADVALPARTAPVAASAQPRLSTAVSKWIQMTMGA
jgi:hypothetical protein